MGPLFGKEWQGEFFNNVRDVGTPCLCNIHMGEFGGHYTELFLCSVFGPGFRRRSNLPETISNLSTKLPSPMLAVSEDTILNCSYYFVQHFCTYFSCLAQLSAISGKGQPCRNKLSMMSLEFAEFESHIPCSDLS